MVNTTNDYLDYSTRDDKLSGGVKLILISTPAGDFKVWTKRIGNNPKVKVLLLHGGPGATHEYFECFDSYLPHAGIEYYYYDQLESFYSNQPSDERLWNLDGFIDEVEQVRKALGLNSDNFYLYGQSWGGILAMEYALAYQKNLKGFIISNMMCSIPDYIQYNTLGYWFLSFIVLTIAGFWHTYFSIIFEPHESIIHIFISDLWYCGCPY